MIQIEIACFYIYFVFTFADHLVKPFGQTIWSVISVEATEAEKKILEAAKKVFEMHGYAGARMQQIADEALMSKASLHYHFRSKEKLFDRIFDETMTEFMALVSTWEDDDQDWEMKLRLFIKNFLSFLKTKSLLFIIREVNRDPELLLARKKDARQRKNRFIAYFERLQAGNHIKADLDPKLIYVFLHSLCAYPILNGVLFKITTQMNEKEFDRFMDAYPEFVANFLIEGIKSKSTEKL